MVERMQFVTFTLPLNRDPMTARNVETTQNLAVNILHSIYPLTLPGYSAGERLLQTLVYKNVDHQIWTIILISGYKNIPLISNYSTVNQKGVSSMSFQHCKHKKHTRHMIRLWLYQILSFHRPKFCLWILI